MVRDVRPGAIETATQEKYLREFKRGWPREAADGQVASLSPDRVEQLIRLFLEKPWLYADWKAAVRASASRSSFLSWEATSNARLWEGQDGTAKASRDILSALAYCHRFDRANVLRAREYFGIRAVPRPQTGALLK